MWETKVQSLGQEDPLGKEMATTSIFLPGESHEQRSLADYSSWGLRELDTAEQLTLSLSPQVIMPLTLFKGIKIKVVF